VKFWDASAIVPLLVVERRTEFALAEQAADPVMAVWWGTEVECASALARLEREERLTAEDIAAVLDVLRRLASDWYVVQPDVRLRNLALRLLRVHPLRAADSLQLAAALTAADGDPETVEFLSFDGELNRSAAREGLRVRTA
jgi:predicted nucleic acid-binding protein